MGSPDDSDIVGTLRVQFWRIQIPIVGLLILISAGCADVKFLRSACPTPRDPHAAANAPAPDAAYRIACPDVLEVAFLDSPEWNAIACVDVDGRLALESPGSPRVEGLTLGEAREELARLAGVEPERVRVWLAAPRSSLVYIHGPIRGRTRAVPYQGPEPVIDFLKRVGGLPPGSELSQVYVIRPNVAAGGRPEVYRVNVPGVLLSSDQSTNLSLLPSDQVYIGETFGSSLSRLMPDWIARGYREIVGLLPDEWWPFSRPRLGDP